MSLKFSKSKQVGRYYHQKAAGKPVDAPESILQEQCEQYLELRGLTFIRLPDALYRAVFGNSVIPPHIKRLISACIKGVPDLTILFPDGTYLAIELKSRSGKQTPGQKQFSRNIRDHYHICRDFESFQKLI